MNEISRSSWLELYKLANSFQRLAPWKWMYDSDIFGVQHPDSGAIGFCSIIGREKDVVGLAIYKGFKGLAGYEQVLESVHHEYPTYDLFALQEYLLISFHPPQTLDSKERARIQQLGLPFPIQSEPLWPRFMDHSTGYVPWPIQTESEATFLMHAMRETMFIAQEIQQDEDYLEAPSEREETLLVRKRMNGTPLWQNHRIQVPATLPKLPHIEVNQLYLISNCLNLPRLATSWLLELFFFPVPTQEAETQLSKQAQRPYYPIVLLVVDLQSGETLSQTIFHPDELSSQLVFSFVEMAKRLGNLPNSLLVSNYQSIGYWEDIARILKLPLELDRDNRFVDEIKGSLFGSLPQ